MAAVTYWDDRAETVGGRVAAFDGIDWDTGTRDMVDLVLPWLPAQGIVVDLGCGIGRMTAPVAKALPACDVVGVDGSDAMLAQQLPAPGNVSFVHADVTALPFDSIDAAYSVLVVQHLDPEQVVAMFAEVRRALRPGGRFVCQWVPGDRHAPQDHHYGLGELVDMAEPLGFVDVFDGVHADWAWAVWEA